MPLSPRATLQRVIVSVTDLDRALILYQQTLALDVTGQGPGLAFLNTGDGAEVLLHQRPARPSDTAVAIAFAVTDLPATVAAWAEHGGVVVDPPAVQPWGEAMAVVRDLDGHLVCLSQAPSTQASPTDEHER